MHTAREVTRPAAAASAEPTSARHHGPVHTIRPGPARQLGAAWQIPMSPQTSGNRATALSTQGAGGGSAWQQAAQPTIGQHHRSLEEGAEQNACDGFALLGRPPELDRCACHAAWSRKQCGERADDWVRRTQPESPATEDSERQQLDPQTVMDTERQPDPHIP